MHFVALCLQSQPDPEAIRGILLAMAAIIPIIILVSIVIVMVPCWFILKKAGLSPWLSLLCCERIKWVDAIDRNAHHGLRTPALRGDSRLPPAERWAGIRS